MKKLVFTHFCEDVAMRIFLEKTLMQLPQHLDVAIKFEHRMSPRVLCPSNRGEVEELFVEAAIKVFQDPAIDFFFVGKDYDDADRRSFDKEFEKLRSQLSSNHQSRTIIFLPVQAIEHWLCYLKQSGTKNISLEGMERKQAKIEIYGAPKVSTARCKDVVEELTQNIDFDWLRNRSHSFNHFYRQIEPIMKAM